MKRYICESVLTSLPDFLPAYLGHGGLIWFMCDARYKWLHPKTSVLCNPKSLSQLPSYSLVERLFRIDQAEVMPRLSLWPLVRLSSAVLSNPRTQPFLHCSNNFEFRNYQAKWRASIQSCLTTDSSGGETLGCSRLKNKSWHPGSWIDPPVKTLADEELGGWPIINAPEHQWLPLARWGSQPGFPKLAPPFFWLIERSILTQLKAGLHQAFFPTIS